MAAVPPNAKIYHIVHADRLGSILQAGGLRCDATMATGPACGTVIGMAGLKARRLRLPVHCHPGTYVGSYVPFYFCPRSIMLYVIHKANDPELAYRGGQGPILHLEADVRHVVAWAGRVTRRWAISPTNASARYSEFFCDPARLDRIDWAAINASDFRPADVRQGKQAEFLLHEFFPWTLVQRIGVSSPGMAQTVLRQLAAADHRPEVRIMPGWYF